LPVYWAEVTESVSTWVICLATAGVEELDEQHWDSSAVVHAASRRRCGT